MKTLTDRLMEAGINKKEFAEQAKSAFSSPQAVEFIKMLSKAVPVAGMSASKDVNETYFNEGQRNTVVEICRYAGVV